MRGIAAFTVRTYATRQDYEPRLSAQILRSQPTNQQFTALRPSRFRSSDKSQDSPVPGSACRYYLARSGDRSHILIWQWTTATLRMTCLTGGLTPRRAATGIPGRPAPSSSPTCRAPCRADEGISGHTVVHCTTDGCRPAWYRPRHYPPDATPSDAAGGPGGEPPSPGAGRPRAY